MLFIKGEPFSLSLNEFKSKEELLHKEIGHANLVPLLGSLSWCPIFKSSHFYNSFEDWASINFTYPYPIFKWVADLPTWHCTNSVAPVMETGATCPIVLTGVYTKFSGRLSEEPFPGLIQKFPCIFIFKTGQPGFQLNLSEGQIRLDLTSRRPLV